MFFLVGVQSYSHELGFYKKEGTCPNCNRTIKLGIVRNSVWLTIFFVPCFPLSIKYFKFCPECGISAQITRKEAKALLK
ncbi:zinc-ribbon domain-containing protein [Treponema zioleckii]|uniref:zinc-ribbon domain-containing protein n=1 Tax=Treponema zioleckii TaxID=331680 RepID=UPI00168B749D|nr:zinc-ribbon domain-containing protein [Treponema zioleckii]